MRDNSIDGWGLPMAYINAFYTSPVASYESSREIGHLSVGSHWLLGTTEIDYTITGKDTGKVRIGEILNYKITR